MKHSRFKDLGIVSSKTPFSNHQFIETTDSTHQLILVDSGAEDDVYSSSDKADNWTQVTGEHGDVSGNKLKRCLWHDRGNNVLYFLVDEAGGSITTLIFWHYPSNQDSTFGSYAQGTDNQPIDIVKIGADIYTFCVTHAHAGSPNDERVRIGGKVVHSNTLLDTNMGAFAGRTSDYSYTVVVGTDIYLLWRWSDENVELWKYDTVANTFVEINDLGANTVIPDRNRKGIAYDGIDILSFIIQDSGDSKYYLWSYIISTDTATKLGEYNISLMLNRNNIGTVPNEFEKAFSIGASETVYEIKARRGGIRILQNMSDITDAVIIAITDNFLMNNDGDMFEFTDVTKEISTIRYNDGIIGIQKKGVFTVHPDFHANWSKGDSIKIYDDNDLLEFHGIINDKNRNRRGIYIFKIDSFTNEIYRKTYNKNYSADDTDTKQKDIIDNGCDFCYRSSSIVGTTTTYDYVYNRAIVYLFWLTRFLERQVPYVEPDGKIWTKAYNALVATGKSWDLNDNSQEVFLIDIPSLEEIVQGFFDGNSGVTRNTIRYKNNATVVRPVAATRDPIEQLQGILPLNEFRDPKLEAATEANQLGDNRYNIWSADTIFLGLRIEGQGYLQPGKTIEIQNTGQITITQDDFLILSFERDPKNDVYMSMILSDNIIFPREFSNLQNTTTTQVHTASVQAIENQSNLTNYEATQHNREIPPSYINPKNGYTSGFNNVYYSFYWIEHGELSKTNNGVLYASFRLPSDYVDGEDFAFKISMYMPAGGNPDTIDYDINIYFHRSGVALGAADFTENATWTHNYNGNIEWEEIITINSGNYLANDTVRIQFRMEDDSNNNVVRTLNMMLIVPVNTRD